jgi:hypothetical protein
MHLAFCQSTGLLAGENSRTSATPETTPARGPHELLMVPEDRFWDLVFQLTPDSSSSRDLAERLCVRCLQPEMRSERLLSELSGQFAAAEASFARLFPKYSEEIQLRSRPLQEQWDAYGPGLLRQMSQILDHGLLVDSAEVLLVPPVSGGMGWAHLHTNRCHIEAMLTNVDPELPEVLRLCWLLSQLDFERPEYSDLINAFRLRRIAGLAMLPPTLLAGERLGIASFDSDRLQRAIQLWRLESTASDARGLGEVLTAWWQTVCSEQTKWSVALTALDRMAHQ